MKNVYSNHSFGETEQRKHQLEHFGVTTMAEQFVATLPKHPLPTIPQPSTPDKQFPYIAAALPPTLWYPFKITRDKLFWMRAVLYYVWYRLLYRTTILLDWWTGYFQCFSYILYIIWIFYNIKVMCIILYIYDWF